jgi:hypothetical protein
VTPRRLMRARDLLPPDWIDAALICGVVGLAALFFHLPV